MKLRLVTLVGLVVAAAVSRLLPHPPNFAPIMAIALFGGAYFSRRSSLIIPLAAMFLSDLLIGFHDQMALVYLSFVLVVLMGWTLAENRTVSRVAGRAVAGSLLFFVMSNFGVWLAGTIYSRDLSGLLSCYVAAIPFFQTQLLGDALYTLTLFGGFALMEKWVRSVRLASCSLPRI
ncbi:MAG: hypothetical protein HYY44_09570 [Deltaproteobacteria bacterium]|nr:hypothetical protein [Deltaproteobacteria bacterium]MBI4373272.1 hypothetical protein [Deltaproteobacteria bacterium]